MYIISSVLFFRTNVFIQPIRVGEVVGKGVLITKLPFTLH